MKVAFLGTNGWYDTKTGNTICTLIENDDYFIILDAGNGFYKLERYIKDTDEKPIYIFLSHFHLDHIEGLHILTKFNFNHGINVYGQLGAKKILNTIVNRPYTVPFTKLPFKADINEIDEGKYNLPFSVESRFLIHASSCLGYRFEIDGKIIAYCIDTGICENAIKLAENADLLIAECSFKIGQFNHEWPHLNPEDAIKIAKEAGAEKLALTHFDANVYRSLEDRMEVENKMKDKFKNLIVAYDDMEIEI